MNTVRGFEAHRPMIVSLGMLVELEATYAGPQTSNSSDLYQPALAHDMQDICDYGCPHFGSSDEACIAPFASPIDNGVCVIICLFIERSTRSS